MTDKKDGILIYDIETRTFGKPDATKDIMKVFGAYSYTTNKYYAVPATDKKFIQTLIDNHKFFVGFNNEAYDNPIIERAGFSLEYKRIIDLRKIIKSRANSMTIKKGLLGNIIMSYSLDYITRLLDLVDESSAKGELDYDILKKDVWSSEERKQIIEYTKRDLEVTKKLYDWVEAYFESFKDFVPQEDVDGKYYLTDSMAKFGYKSVCHAMGWQPELNKDFKNDGEQISGGYCAFPSGEKFSAKYVDGCYRDIVVLLDYSSLYPHIMMQANLHGRNKETNEGWHGGHLFKVRGYYNDKELSGIGKLIRKWYFLRLFYKRKIIMEDGTIIKFKDVEKYKDKKYYHVPEEHGRFELELLVMDDDKIKFFNSIGNEKDPREYTIKILINLNYGILCQQYYKLVYDPIAGDDCTSLGRQMVKYARKIFREAGYPLINTDSVSANSIVSLSNGENISVEEYWEQYAFDREEDEKEYAKCSQPILTCDDRYKNLFSLPKQIIRHKTSKKMYRIYFTNEEFIEVTEDHSLITIDPINKKLISVKPDKIKKLKYVLQNRCNRYAVKSKKFNKEMYFLMGLIIADGNLIKPKDSKKYRSIALSNEHIKLVIEKIIKPLQEIYDFNISWKGKPTDISINSTNIAEMLYDLGFNGQSHNKKIPEWLNFETKENITEFLKGYFTGDGGILIRDGNPIIRASSINKTLLLGIKNLFNVLGYRTSIYSENKKTSYNGKKSKYNMIYLNVLDKYKFIDNIGFLYDIDSKFHNKTEEEVWFGTNEDAKEKTSHIKKYSRLMKSNMRKIPEADFFLRNIKKIETFFTKEYVYDFSMENYERFYANNILVHNTDSWYFIDVFNDKQKYLALKDKVIADIKSSMPFPQITFDADIDAEIKHIFFFKGKQEDKESDSEMDEDDIINKPKGFMKKNYIYITLDDKVVVKNLGIKKKNISALSKKIFWDFMVPRAKADGNIKFYKTEIENMMRKYLTDDLTLAYMRKEVGELKNYKNSMTGIQAQITKKYGPGIHFLIPNKRNIGVGKGIKYCSIDDFKNYDMGIADIDFNNFWKELNYFIKEAKPVNLFSICGDE